MTEMPPIKVGVIACSGEELAEGTVTRQATLRVLHQLRPADTVTICLPLFLAGGEGERNFARCYPTIAVDGCEKRCAFHGTEKYSNRPAASIVVSDLLKQLGLEQPCDRRKLDVAGMHAIDATATRIASMVDQLLSKIEK